MDAQLTTALAPKYLKSNRYDLEDIKKSAPLNNSDFYHNSAKQQKERISTYDKIVQELSKDENNSIGKPFISILGGGDTNVFNPSTSPGRNTNVGGTLTLYPSGGIHFQNFKPSFRIDLPIVSSQLSSETKGISNRGSTPTTISPPQLLDFVEEFNKQEDENLCPEDFLDYRDSQAVELATDSDGEMVNQDDLVNNNCIDNQSAHNECFDDKQQLFTNRLAQLVTPLPTISSSSEISSLKEEIENNTICNTSEIPELTFKEKIPNVTISSAVDNQSTLDLLSRVRSFSSSSFGMSMESTNLINREHNMSVSPMSSISNAVSWKSDDTINLSTPKNSTSNFPIPPTRERKISESVLGFFNGIFGSSPTQSISERSEHIKEVAEMSMIFRY